MSANAQEVDAGHIGMRLGADIVRDHGLQAKLRGALATNAPAWLLPAMAVVLGRPPIADERSLLSAFAGRFPGGAADFQMCANDIDNYVTVELPAYPTPLGMFFVQNAGAYQGVYVSEIDPCGTIAEAYKNKKEKKEQEPKPGYQLVAVDEKLLLGMSLKEASQARY